MRTNKCPLCDDRFDELEDLYNHLEEEHIESIPKNFTPAQYVYYIKTGKEHGSCVIDGKPTRWNEVSGKYNRFCDNPKCKETYKEEFRKRMIGKYGKMHLLDEPEQQKKMLANRKISGMYEWSDGSNIKKQYTGTYEQDFLRFLDILMNWDPEDILCPSPHTYYYEYEGEKKFYIPDVFIASINTEVEIKDGGDNPNMHHKIQEVDKVKEKLKDEVLMSQKSFNYIKITNKNYEPFFELLFKLKKQFIENGEKNIQPIFVVKESVIANIDNKEEITNINESASSILSNIISNHHNYLKVISTFNDMKPQMLDTVKNIKSLDDAKKLRHDADNIKKYINNLKKSEPRLKDACEEHIEWINRVYLIAILEKEQVLSKEQFMNKKINKSLEESVNEIVEEAKNIVNSFVRETNNNFMAGILNGGSALNEYHNDMIEFINKYKDSKFVLEKYEQSLAGEKAMCDNSKDTAKGGQDHIDYINQKALPLLNNYLK
jgi:hypothetical protein